MGQRNVYLQQRCVRTVLVTVVYPFTEISTRLNETGIYPRGIFVFPGTVRINGCYFPNRM